MNIIPINSVSILFSSQKFLFFLHSIWINHFLHPSSFNEARNECHSILGKEITRVRTRNDAKIETAASPTILMTVQEYSAGLTL